MDRWPILKSPDEIEAMRPAGQLTARTLQHVGRMIQPGVTTAELDQAAEAFIRDAGGVPLFLNYPSHQSHVKPFPGTLCVSVNDEVVHGLPDQRRLQSGDIISIDVGARLNGWCGDSAYTFPVGEISKKTQKLLRATEQSLHKGIASFRAGALMKDISRAIQGEIEGAGFSVVKQFVGHGIGRDMHEPPQVPNYVDGLRAVIAGEKGLERLRLEVGMVLAIEPMANMGKSGVYVEPENGWIVKTRDRSLSAHFEHTVALTENGPVILTLP